MPTHHRPGIEIAESRFIEGIFQVTAFQLAPLSAASPFTSCSGTHALELLKSGVRTGDQLLKVGDQSVQGMELDDVLRLLRKRYTFRFVAEMASLPC